MKYPTDALLDWISAEIDPRTRIPNAHDWFLMQLPRISYIKNLPKNSVLLDMGAGDGSLILFRDWLMFPRKDLTFVGLSLEHGLHTLKYDEFIIHNIDDRFPEFQYRPTSVIGCQFIEHVRDPKSVFAWLHEILPPGGTVFLDWPSTHTVDLPTKNVFISAGYDVTALNSYDDRTHQSTYSLSAMAKLAQAGGFETVNQGIVDMPFLADRLRDEGRLLNDKYLLSMALWLKANFVSYGTYRKTE